jgi:hypothetical protein
MLSIAGGANKQVFLTGHVTGAAFTAKFFLRFVSHLVFSFLF